MARDPKKNSATDSGMRGSSRQSSSGSKPKPLAGGAECVSVRRAENGYIVSCSYPPKSGKNYIYVEPKQYTFSNAAEVAEFIEKELGVKDDK
jgi:hypothetical protein